MSGELSRCAYVKEVYVGFWFDCMISIVDKYFAVHSFNSLPRERVQVSCITFTHGPKLGSLRVLS